MKNNEMSMTVETDKPVSPEEVPANTQVIIVPPTPVKIESARSRAGITKKIARPAAEKKARKLAKKMRKMNRRRN